MGNDTNRPGQQGQSGQGQQNQGDDRGQQSGQRSGWQQEQSGGRQGQRAARVSPIRADSRAVSLSSRINQSQHNSATERHPGQCGRGEDRNSR